MKIKFTRTPTITKAAIATVVFTIVFLATTSNLPSCTDAVAALNAGGCIVRQSYLHAASGWLALASLITGVVPFILKQRKTSSVGRHQSSASAGETPLSTGAQEFTSFGASVKATCN